MSTAMMLMGLSFGIAGVVPSYLERVLGMGYRATQSYMKRWFGVTFVLGIFFFIGVLVLVADLLTIGPAKKVAASGALMANRPVVDRDLCIGCGHCAEGGIIMSRIIRKGRVLFVVSLAVILWGLASSAARAHCDTMDGPVVNTARMALDKGDVTPVLKWVRMKDDGLVRSRHTRESGYPGLR